MGLIVILSEERHGNEASEEGKEAIRVKLELLRRREERERAVKSDQVSFSVICS